MYSLWEKSAGEASKTRMMKTEKENILDKIGRKDGMTVPDGYFDDFQRRMEAMLPYNAEAESPQKPEMPRTFWERVRPFVYMAAMFAGVWCMVKMFSMFGPGNVDLSIENNQVLSSALSDDTFIYEYLRDDVSERELYEEMFLDSISVEDMIPADSL